MATILPFRKAIPQVLVSEFSAQGDPNMARRKTRFSQQINFTEYLEPEVIGHCKVSDDNKTYHETQLENKNLYKLPVFVNSLNTVSQTYNLGRIPTALNLPSPDRSDANTEQAASLTVLWPKNPLRLITARAPQYVESNVTGTLSLHAYLETLECGHQVWVTPQYDDEVRDRYVDITARAKRRRCPECKAVKKASAPEKSAKRRGVA